MKVLRRSRMFLLGLIACVPIGAEAPPEKEPVADVPRSISLVYIADLHAQLETHPELFWHGGTDEMTTAGGVARIATAVQKIREEMPGRVLFMDAGDSIQGSAAAAWSKGEDVVPALNALGLDLGIPGNWEVVYGRKVLEERARELRYPLIAANLRQGEPSKLVFPAYSINTVNGVRIGIIGFTDPDVPTRQPPSYSKGLTYTNTEVLQPLIDELRAKEKVDLVVLLTHIGLPKAIRLAEILKGVDFVLSADTHERTYEPIVRGTTWIVEPGSFGSFLGKLDITMNAGKIVAKKWELIELRADRFAEDPRVKRIVDQTLAPMRTKLEKVLGATQVPLMRYNVVETSVDDMLSDALQEAAGTEIALSNGFRSAAPHTSGPIRESDIWDWYPISTKLKAGKASGKQLRAFWERELDHVFSPDAEKLFGGWVPRPSGMTLEFVAHAPQGQRVRTLLVGGKPIDDNRIYTIVACEREGDAFDTLCRIPHVQDPTVLDLDAHEAVRRYLAKHSPIAAPRGGRVVVKDLPTPVRSQVLSNATTTKQQSGQ